MGAVYQGKVNVCVDMAAKVHMAAAPVGVERRLYAAALPDFGEHLPQQRLPPRKFRRSRLVEVVQAVQTHHLLLKQRPVHGQVQLSTVHFFLNGHNDSSKHPFMSPFYLSC